MRILLVYRSSSMMFRNSVSSKSFPVLSHGKDLKIRREAGISQVILWAMCWKCVLSNTARTKREKGFITPRRALPKQGILVVRDFSLLCKKTSISSLLSELIHHWKTNHAGCDVSFCDLTKAATCTMLAFSPNSTDTHSELIFLNLYFKALKEHMSDFQKSISRLGQRYCIVCHTDVISMYITHWQVKLAHTRFNPHAYSFLLIPHCTVTI